MSYGVGDNFSLQGQESDGEDWIQFAGLVNFVNQETFSTFLDSTETPREYKYMYYEIYTDYRTILTMPEYTWCLSLSV